MFYLSNGNPDIVNIGQGYWLSSPATFAMNRGWLRAIGNLGNTSFYSANSSYGTRPVISLKHDVTIESGDGSEATPWIVN